MREALGDNVVGQISEERKKTGRRLYAFAWVIEVLAVLIGVGIAAMQLFASFSELNSAKESGLEFGDWANIFIAATPFIMVAIVEITKIPFVDAFYKTSSRLWKTVFLASLIIISLITFESALNGFERNFNALNISVSRLQKQLLVVQELMGPLELKIERAQSLTLQDIETQFTNATENLTQQKLSQVRGIEERKALLQASVQTQFTSALQSQIETSKQRISSLQSQLTEELNRSTSSFARQEEARSSAQQDEIRQLVQDYNREQTRLDQVKREAATAINEANFFTKASVSEQQEQRISDQEKEVSTARERLEKARSGALRESQQAAFRADQDRIREQFGAAVEEERLKLSNLTAEYNQAIGLRSKDLESSLSALDQEIERINQRFDPQFSELSEIRNQQLKTLENNESLIAGWSSELDSLRDDRVQLRDQTNTAIGKNQVYRMAQLFSGVESAADIPPEYVIRIAAIWFGSLAAMVAFTGVILALASNVILDPRKPDHDPDSKGVITTIIGKTVRSARRGIAYRRRLDRKPIIKERIVELTKEIPVEKVVTVEVPVEIVRKELVHVPVYTNDPKLLATGEKLSPSAKSEAGEKLEK